MYLGINLSHDSSVAITDKNGNVLYAIAEERISRTKLHAGIPAESLKLLSEVYDFDSIENVVIGSNQDLNTELLRRTIADIKFPQYRKKGLGYSVTPGLQLSQNPQTVEIEFYETLQKFTGKKKILLPKHHDSHLGCAIGVANSGDSALLISLDGKGDGESGAVSSIKASSNGVSQVYTQHARFPVLDSFGHLYNAVTKAYNFKPVYHDGKITGLAAYGSYSTAVEVLLKYVTVSNGIPTIKQPRNLKDRILRKSFRYLGLSQFAKKNLEEIVSLAEAQTTNFPDLAFAIQEVLEKSVIEIVTHWQDRLRCHTLALSGGVFANVKLNQKLSELELFEDVRIFPNMGDGGISVGGIWFELYKRGELARNELFQNMFLAPDLTHEEGAKLKELQQNSRLQIEYIKDEQLPALVAKLICNGAVGAVHRGRMEFGPRALCNRSILADPRDGAINRNINHRLHRTEFMPFAPVVKIENFSKYFQIPPTQSLFPFKYMTMTCRVKSEYAEYFPGVVHVDQTARPQVVEKQYDQFTWAILDEFEKLTGIGILVNTSFNVHEEPINFKLEDSIEALLRNAVDFLVYNNYLIRV